MHHMAPPRVATPRHRFRSAPCALSAALALAGVLAASQVGAQPAPAPQAQPASSTPAPAPAPAPTTHTVQPEDLRIEFEHPAIYDARVFTNLQVKTDAWQNLTLSGLPPHGTVVKKGEVVAYFETVKIDEALAAAQRALDAAELNLKQQEHEFQLALAAGPRLEEEAARNLARTEENHKTWVKEDRPLRLRAAEMIYKASEQRLAYETEELRQLEKMYKADDLTEETEEIILRRQKNTVEHLRFAQEQAKVALDRAVRVEIPRFDDDWKTSLAAAKEAHEKAKVALPTGLKLREIAMAEARVKIGETRENLAKLRKDREKLAVKAPHDGLFYHGPAAANGRWSGFGAAAGRLVEGSPFKPGEAFACVLDPAALVVRLEVPEEQIRMIRPGAPVLLSVVVDSVAKAMGKVETVAAAPVGLGKFEVLVAVPGPTPPSLLPSYQGKAKILAYHKPQALMVPAAAVFDGHVYVARPGDQPADKRAVKLGVTHAGKTEIIEGLNANDVVLLRKP